MCGRSAAGGSTPGEVGRAARAEVCPANGAQFARSQAHAHNTVSTNPKIAPCSSGSRGIHPPWRCRGVDSLIARSGTHRHLGPSRCAAAGSPHHHGSLVFFSLGLVVVEVERAVGAQAFALAARLLLHTRPAELGLVTAVDALAAVRFETVCASSTPGRTYPLAHLLVVFICAATFRAEKVEGGAHCAAGAAEYEQRACSRLPRRAQRSVQIEVAHARLGRKAVLARQVQGREHRKLWSVRRSEGRRDLVGLRHRGRVQPGRVPEESRRGRRPVVFSYVWQHQLTTERTP
mmetsp:Transcript_6627/g.16263  ORF Transcript_6627/g.16263 Transcript_6627/m.16263 type:complete len:290 (-) Transcript_6627:19-888(-)|eukprot:CAMPEP_0185564932 /NCGR_PEP_ID=MMETSP1381-20130426/65353_1 /TAXON_ID=298111 /ORGANISM="Pavlova sp., Strain CCMP459" /LENGTH=289 /DNA_ID=CAMNT_0028178877 /DNA_START=1007 /DNA_END=1876 /DNA_ORIENTATION=-